MTIWQIGLNKTGSTSLNSALKILGLKSNHDFRLRNIFKEQNYDHPLINEYDAFCDGSFYNDYKFISKKFPKDKFIFATREKEEWIRSLIIHTLYNRIFNPKKQLVKEIDTNKMSEMYDQLHLEVPKFFKDSNRLLILPLGSGWEPLCEFLKKPIPDVSYPNLNKGNKKLKDILNHYNPIKFK